MKSLHISLDIVHSGCKPINFMLSLTHSLQVFLPLPLHFTPAMQLHISTGWHPIIHILTFQMHKPPQSATPHHICQPHIEYPKDCKNPHFAFHPSTHPYHHHMLHPLQTMPIFSLHCPCFSFIMSAHSGRKLWAYIPTLHWVQSQPLSAKLIGHDLSRHLFQ